MVMAMTPVRFNPRPVFKPGVTLLAHESRPLGIDVSIRARFLSRALPEAKWDELARLLVSIRARFLSRALRAGADHAARA